MFILKIQKQVVMGGIEHDLTTANLNQILSLVQIYIKLSERIKVIR